MGNILDLATEQMKYGLFHHQKWLLLQGWNIFAFG